MEENCTHTKFNNLKKKKNCLHGLSVVGEIIIANNKLKQNLIKIYQQLNYCEIFCWYLTIDNDTYCYVCILFCDKILLMGKKYDVSSRSRLEPVIICHLRFVYKIVVKIL